MHSSFSLLTYEYLHICGSRFRGGIGISSPSLKGLWSKVEQRGGKFEFSSLWHFANISGCHLDETKSHALYLDIWKYKNTKNMIVVPYCSTASLIGLPCWQQPNENLEHRFCIFLSWAERFPFWLPFFYHVSLQHLKKKIPSYILFPLVPSHLSSKLSFTFWLILFFCMKRRSFWRRREQRAREERGQGLHFVILLFCVSKACSPAWLPCELLCEGARHRSPRAVKHCSLFSIVASHEERYSREEERLQFTLELCLCLYNCAYLLWEESCQRALNFNISSLILLLLKSL